MRNGILATLAVIPIKVLFYLGNAFIIISFSREILGILLNTYFQKVEVLDNIIINIYVRKQLHWERSVDRLLKYKAIRRKLKIP